MSSSRLSYHRKKPIKPKIITSTKASRKRIEYRGRYLRASRTGGVALRAQVRAGNINVTANSTGGVRVSRRLFKGTQIALKAGRTALHGRYQGVPLKLNLARSGLSASSKVGPGTVSWTRPLRSSATVAGVNVRGRNALAIYYLCCAEVFASRQ